MMSCCGTEHWNGFTPRSSRDSTTSGQDEWRDDDVWQGRPRSGSRSGTTNASITTRLSPSRHHRSASCRTRKARRPTELSLVSTTAPSSDGQVADRSTSASAPIRPRTYSMPPVIKSRQDFLDAARAPRGSRTALVTSHDRRTSSSSSQGGWRSSLDSTPPLSVPGEELVRVRTFSTSSKGRIRNHGDSFKRKNPVTSVRAGGGESRTGGGEARTGGGEGQGNSSTLEKALSGELSASKTADQLKELNLTRVSSANGVCSKTSSGSSAARCTSTSSNGESIGRYKMIKAKKGDGEEGAVVVNGDSRGVGKTGRECLAEVRTCRVVVLGSEGVGKTSIVEQFMTSEYIGLSVDEMTSQIDEEDARKRTIFVSLDGVESTLELLQTINIEELSADDVGCSLSVDAYCVVYSTSDVDSFEFAVQTLRQLKRREMTLDAATILVGNKADLERNRQVAAEDGKAMAIRFGTKFIEVSALLNHKIDDLLVGLMKQIMLKRERRQRRNLANIDDDDENHGCDRNGIGLGTGCYPAREIVDMILGGKNRRLFNSCDNLLVP